jgi:hypothetical protein
VSAPYTLTQAETTASKTHSEPTLTLTHMLFNCFTFHVKSVRAVHTRAETTANRKSVGPFSDRSIKLQPTVIDPTKSCQILLELDDPAKKISPALVETLTDWTLVVEKLLSLQHSHETFLSLFFFKS